ncbi:MAG: carbonic anhydrase [Bacteroidota bacterium]
MSKRKEDYQKPMNEKRRLAMTPQAAYNRLRAGNDRYTGKYLEPDKKDGPRVRKRGNASNNFISKSANGQNPFAMVLSCVDSRIPTEVIFDQEIGDIFNARIAGNFVNADILGSMEFAAGYIKLIVVMGHTACGAVDAACAAVHPRPTCGDKETDVEQEPSPTPSNLLQLVDKLIYPVVATPFVPVEEEKDECEHWDNYVNTVAEANVRKTMNDILSRSPLLRHRITDNLEDKQKIGLVGAIYNVANGQVTFLNGGVPVSV